MNYEKLILTVAIPSSPDYGEGETSIIATSDIVELNQILKRELIKGLLFPKTVLYDADTLYYLDYPNIYGYAVELELEIVPEEEEVEEYHIPNKYYVLHKHKEILQFCKDKSYLVHCYGVPPQKTSWFAYHCHKTPPKCYRIFDPESIESDVIREINVDGFKLSEISPFTGLKPLADGIYEIQCPESLFRHLKERYDG